MTNNSPDYKRLFEEEQRRRKEAEQGQQEEQRRREQAEQGQQQEQRRREEEQRRREEAETQTRPTTLPQYLDACHVHLQSGLAVQSVALSTKGDPSNARRKKRPDRISRWSDFPLRQSKIWTELVSSLFMTEGHFTSRHTMQENGETVRRRMVGSELDIHHFQRTTVEEPVSLMIERIFNDDSLREKFGLRGSVQFENHANTLSPDEALSENMRSMEISDRGRRRSPRLMERRRRDEASSRPKSPVSRPNVTSRPRADQFCVYNISTDPEKEERVPAFIVEYKAPHKLNLRAIREYLQDMNLQEVLEEEDCDTPRKRYQRLVAAAITQAFSYMVSAGLEFGYVCTGEAFIFLRVPEDPTTVYYFLSMPQTDVGDSTGWSDDAPTSTNNRLDLTAVAQVLAFTLQALQSSPRSHEWRAKAEDSLSTWEYAYSDILDDAPAPETTPSEYWPSPDNQLAELRVSPIALRRGPAQRLRVGCRLNSETLSEEDESGADQGDSSTPSQRSRRLAVRDTKGRGGSGKDPKATEYTRGTSGNHRARLFCTRRCLLGLIRGGDLDRSCPNVNEHGRTVHRISKDNFHEMMRDQLSRTLDTNFEPCGRPGSRGVPFKATLASHGYTVIAKCTPADFVSDLKHEADVYKRLHPIQGRYVPAYLGSLDLLQPYYFEGIAKLVHVMFLEYVGTPIYRHCAVLDQQHVLWQVEQCMEAIHQLNVLHQDIMPRNILRNGESGEVTIIDFERAKILPARVVLGPLSINRKRKQTNDVGNRRRIDCGGKPFAREMAKLRAGIICL
jgi:hypothetical protein